MWLLRPSHSTKYTSIERLKDINLTLIMVTGRVKAKRVKASAFRSHSTPPLAAATQSWSHPVGARSKQRRLCTGRVAARPSGGSEGAGYIETG